MNFNNGYVEAELARIKPLAQALFTGLVTKDIAVLGLVNTVEGEVAFAAYQEYLDYQLSKRSGAV
jgi:hypothetical protein